RFTLDHRQDVKRVDLGDRPPTQSRHEYAPDHPLDLGTAALGSDLLLDEVLGDRTKRNGTFAQLGDTLALLLHRRIPTGLYERLPGARRLAGGLQRHDRIFTERAARGGAVAREARDEDEGLHTLLGHADPHAARVVIHDFVTLAFRLQRLEQFVGQCSLHRIPLLDNTG